MINYESCRRFTHKDMNQGTNIEELPKLSMILVTLKRTWEESCPLGVIFIAEKAFCNQELKYHFT